MIKKILLILSVLLLVSLVKAQECDCSFDNTCMSIGEQRLTEEQGYEVYCSTEKKIEIAKDDGEICNFDYECVSYSCEDNICKGASIKEKSGFPYLIIIFIAIIIGMVIFTIFKIISSRKPKKKPEKEEEKVEVGYPPYSKVSSSKEYDILEKKLKKSMEEIEKIGK